MKEPKKREQKFSGNGLGVCFPLRVCRKRQQRPLSFPMGWLLRIFLVGLGVQINLVVPVISKM